MKKIDENSIREVESWCFMIGLLIFILFGISVLIYKDYQDKTRSRECAKAQYEAIVAVEYSWPDWDKTQEILHLLKQQEIKDWPEVLRNFEQQQNIKKRKGK